MATKKKAAPAKSASQTSTSNTSFTADEKAAMRDRARELKASASKADGLKELNAKIAAMKEPDRSLAKRIHALVMAAAPDLAPKTWYGMPAYAKDGDVVCFFQDAAKFKSRYATLGFIDKAKIDEGAMWPTSYAITTLSPADEAKITALVKKAVS
jgi:uncharacterized protein YdhG (YjbR/CyaY superfamily)